MPEIDQNYCSKCETKVEEGYINCPKCYHFLDSDRVIRIKEQIKKLRKQGKTLAQISKVTGKSIYYIYSRLNNK